MRAAGVALILCGLAVLRHARHVPDVLQRRDALTAGEQLWAAAMARRRRR